MLRPILNFLHVWLPETVTPCFLCARCCRKYFGSSKRLTFFSKSVQEGKSEFWWTLTHIGHFFNKFLVTQEEMHYNNSTLI